MNSDTLSGKGIPGSGRFRTLLPLILREVPVLSSWFLAFGSWFLALGSHSSFPLGHRLPDAAAVNFTDSTRPQFLGFGSSRFLPLGSY